MRKLILMFMLVISTLAYSQTTEKINQIGYNTYSYYSNSGNIIQTGTFILEEGVLIKHGIWKLRINNKLVNKGVYFRNNLQELTIYNKRTRTKLKANDIKIVRLQAKVNKLQQLVATH
jgi:hypothetical protein